MTGAPDGLLGHPPIVDLLVGPVPKPIRNDPQVLIARWRQRYNTIQPHSALGYRPQRRGSPVRSLRLQLSKRTGLVYWRAKP